MTHVKHVAQAHGHRSRENVEPWSLGTSDSCKAHTPRPGSTHDIAFTEMSEDRIWVFTWNETASFAIQLLSLIAAIVWTLWRMGRQVIQCYTECKQSVESTASICTVCVAAEHHSKLTGTRSADYTQLVDCLSIINSCINDNRDADAVFNRHFPINLLVQISSSK